MTMTKSRTIPDTAALPVNVDRRQGAALIAQRYFPVSLLTLERWPLAWRRVNNRAVTSTADLLAEAQRRFDAAPVTRTGHPTA